MLFDKAKTLRAAEKYLELGKIPAAIKEYTQIVANEPDDFATVNTLGDLHSRVGNQPAAISCFRRLAEHYREQDFGLKAIAVQNPLSSLADDVIAAHRVIGMQDGPVLLAGHSWGTASWGLAVTRAATALREKLATVPSIPAGGISVKVDTAQEVQAMGHPERHAYAAQFAEVAVDVGTGEVRVRRLLGTFAIGRVVNPLTVSSQLIGGMTWGLSMALHEAGVMDPTFGTHVNADLAGYHIAAHADVPPIEVSWVDDEDLHNPTGIKGAGEIGIVGTAAAIANAVWHATGVRHRALPITPDRVLRPGSNAAK